MAITVTAIGVFQICRLIDLNIWYCSVRHKCRAALPVKQITFFQ